MLKNFPNRNMVLTDRSLTATLVRRIRQAGHHPAFSGILLIIAASAAMIMANSPLSGLYHSLFHYDLPWTPVAKLNTPHLWINDALMAVFFFVVGLEVKREIVAGQLADPRQRRLPIAAAVAGMAAPAAVYITIAGGDPALLRGWAIPAATDIAFAMGVLALVGNRVPAPLRLFLLTVAIVDDIGAVLIIAALFTAGLKLGWLLAAMIALGTLIMLGRKGIRPAWPYALAALALWYCILHSGIHATIAGVAAALAIPMTPADMGKPSLLERMEHALTGWNSLLIIPLFGFANAGVSLAGSSLASLVAPLPLAIAAGLVLGKQSGVMATIWIADKTGLAPRPTGSSWLHIWGIAVLCGIGFTMSLFIAMLAFPAPLLQANEAKLGILGGSLVSALLGYTILRLAPAPTRTG